MSERSEYVKNHIEDYMAIGHDYVYAMIAASTDATLREFDEIEDDDDDLGCDGHESLDGAHMGETVYCDGTCR